MSDPTISEPTITVRFYRIVMGVRTPYILTLDGRRNLITEQVDHEALGRMAERGLILSQTSATPISSWFEASSPNPFPGTDALRTQYFSEVRATEEEHRARGVACPDCVLGSILRQYKVTLHEQGYPT